ncbi:UPF0390 protein [Lachnellula hyalina]|uniref:UPF0390 protein n=1 Tax=Lachnellula hyalina TaxID=1316788 RepID=A0A8H8R8H0_9HELO|nr:UPF0390 protein [Lachnellula hyalina]TVY29631.1 UPF0390 protein [Lachnellula hyalina]
MAQGAIKGKSTAPTAKSTGRRQTALGPKKGARTIAPRKQVLVRNAKMTKMGQLTDVLKLKKHSAGLTAMTERTLGAKAGHLELLKGGKKNKDTKEGELPKGGSKKFG